MACDLTSGFSLDCNDGIGGIDEVLIGNYENFTTTPLTVAAGVITAITQEASTSIFRYELEQEDADFISTENRSAENGTFYVESVLNFTIDKLSAAKSEELKIMAAARKLFVIVKDNSGTYWALGSDYGAMKQGGTNQAASGKAYGDRSGYTVGITAKEGHYPYEVDSAAIATLTIA